MTSEAWRQVKELYEEASALDAAARRALLDRLPASDPVRCEVEALLDAPDPGEEFLETAPIAAGALDAYAGKRLGVYEVIRRVGSGGTSTVYEAFRRDGQYEQRVAIKVVRAGMDRAFILRRLHTERQILAGLSHPGIARLFDGGATPEGSPYLVMEYIEGEPVTDYCERQNLGVRERLELFEQICAAVQHAHRNLVVHRDIKPANVLVTGDGTAKLLDFGIAKLLDGGVQMHETAASTRMLTPEYASPEQVLGEAITTSTDVYSLGVLLYEMLCGERPYRVAHDSPLEMAKQVCETAPRKPSMVASGVKASRELAGDLDNIVLKAMRKEPERRYLSVEQFAGDVRRFLEGRPVLARHDTLAYRAAKFLRRNLAASVAAGLLLLAIVAGTGATIWQARVATRERARAERRFNEVRELARNTLFEIDGAIGKLPGATEARALLCDRAVKLLDGLARDSSGDYALELELSEAYRRLARVQGNVLEANVGDHTAAQVSARKAVALAEAALALRPGDRVARRDLSRSLFQVASAGERGDRLAVMDRAIAIDEALLKDSPSGRNELMGTASAYQMRGSLRVSGDRDGALRDQQRSLELSQRVVDAGCQDERCLSTLSFAHKKVGGMLIRLERLNEAAEHYAAALKLDEGLLAKAPNDPVLRYDLTFALSDTGFIYARQHEYKRAIGLYLRVLEIRETLTREDPRNMRTRHGVVSTCNYLAGIYREQSDFQNAAAYRDRALKSNEVLVRAAPKEIDTAVQRADLYIDLGDDYKSGGKRAEADAAFRQAQEIAIELKARGATEADRLLKAIGERLREPIATMAR
ncbi:MAG TPA: protein kinase [Candidatus Solibacter sp.]|nr:protein kinase [Candidatus Solibacter sp.]